MGDGWGVYWFAGYHLEGLRKLGLEPVVPRGFVEVFEVVAELG